MPRFKAEPRRPPRKSPPFSRDDSKNKGGFNERRGHPRRRHLSRTLEGSVVRLLDVIRTVDLRLLDLRNLCSVRIVFHLVGSGRVWRFFPFFDRDPLDHFSGAVGDYERVGPCGRTVRKRSDRECEHRNQRGNICRAHAQRVPTWSLTHYPRLLTPWTCRPMRVQRPMPRRLRMDNRGGGGSDGAALMWMTVREHEALTRRASRR